MYQILITTLAAMLISQLSKVFIKSNRLKLNWRSLTSYSGMPSGHATTTVSLATIIGLTQGFNSPLFAVTVIFAILIIRDALGLRSYVGLQSEVLNVMVKDLKEDNAGLDENYPHLVEKVGHTPTQVIAGSLLGFLISLISYYIF